MRRILHVIDSISDWAGKIVCWATVALVGVVITEVFVRYVLSKSLMWSMDTDLMLGTAVFCAGWAYALRHHAHVRIDVFYTRLSPRARAIVDVIGALLLFFPLIIVLIQTSGYYTWNAFVKGETSLLSYWYPIMWPWRALVLLGFILLLLQGAAQFFRDSYLMIRNKPYA